MGISKEHSGPNRSPDVDGVAGSVYPLLVMLTTANGDILPSFYILSYLLLLGVSKCVCVFFSGTLEISSGVSKVSLFDEWGML